MLNSHSFYINEADNTFTTLIFLKLHKERPKTKKKNHIYFKFYSMSATFRAYMIMCIGFFCSNNASYSYFSCQWIRKYDFHNSNRCNMHKKVPKTRKKNPLLQNFIPWVQLLAPIWLCVSNILVPIIFHSHSFHINEINNTIFTTPIGLKSH